MTLYRAELQKIIRIVRNDPRAIAAGIVAPSLVLIVFVLLFGGLSSMPIGIINQDRGEWGTRLETEILKQMSPLGDIPYYIKKESTLEKAEASFTKGKLVGIIIIPADFSQGFTAEKSPQIIYHLNNYNTDFAKNLRLYLQEGIYSFYKKYYQDIKIEIKEVVSTSAQVEWVDIIAVGTFLLACIIGGMFNYLYVYFKEKQYGTLLLYGTAPNGPLMSFAARTTLALLNSLFAGLINALLIYFILDFNVLTHLSLIVPALFLSAMIYICAAAVFSIYMNNFYGAVIGSMLGAMIFWFFSGGFNTMVPENPILLFFFRILPNSYALDIMRGSIFGSQYLDNRLNYTALLLMMLLLLGWALYLYRNRLWKRPRL